MSSWWSKRSKSEKVVIVTVTTATVAVLAVATSKAIVTGGLVVAIKGKAVIACGKAAVIIANGLAGTSA